MLQWFNKKLHNRKGFTLIELVVVIAILGVLAAIAVPRFTNSTQAARDAALDANIRTLNGAVAMYLAQEGNKKEDFASMDAEAAIQKLVEADMLTSAPAATGISFDATNVVFSKTASPSTSPTP